MSSLPNLCSLPTMAASVSQILLAASPTLQSSTPSHCSAFSPSHGSPDMKASLASPSLLAQRKLSRHGRRTMQEHKNSSRISCQAVIPGAPGVVTSVAEKVQLGASPVTVTPLGIGSWAWGDSFFWNEGSWDDIKMKQAKGAFEASLGAGLTFFDTAEVYGTKMFGGEDSEALLGRFIKETKSSLKGEVVVATKFAALPYRIGRESVVKTLKDSLKRLDQPSVDLYQIHWPGVWQNEAYIDGLGDAVEQGLARAVGVSNFSEKRMRDAHAQLAKRGIPLASNQVHYSLLYRKPEENGVKAAADELGITIIAYSPINQGVLSGKYTPQNPPKGPRGQIFTPEYLEKVVPVIAKMREIGDRYGGKTPTQVALNWLIAQGNTIPIPGAKSREQAVEFSGALGWILTSDEVEELRDLAKNVATVTPFPAESM